MLNSKFSIFPPKKESQECIKVFNYFHYMLFIRPATNDDMMDLLSYIPPIYHEYIKVFNIENSI